MDTVPPTTLPLSDPTPISIEGIDCATIASYFETLNMGEFAATGALFAEQGELKPPFEDAVVGPTAIAAYLEREAKGFILQPQQGVEKAIETGCTEVLVTGRVQTPLFSVNVSWLFMLDSQQRLLLAKVKLLASAQELLKLRS